MAVMLTAVFFASDGVWGAGQSLLLYFFLLII